MASPLHGSCLCGAIRYELAVDEKAWKKVRMMPIKVSRNVQYSQWLIRSLLWDRHRYVIADHAAKSLAAQGL